MMESTIDIQALRDALEAQRDATTARYEAAALAARKDKTAGAAVASLRLELDDLARQIEALDAAARADARQREATAAADAERRRTRDRERLNDLGDALNERATALTTAVTQITDTLAEIDRVADDAKRLAYGLASDRKREDLREFRILRRSELGAALASAGLLDSPRPATPLDVRALVQHRVTQLLALAGTIQ